MRRTSVHHWFCVVFLIESAGERRKYFGTEGVGGEIEVDDRENGVGSENLSGRV